MIRVTLDQFQCYSGTNQAEALAAAAAVATVLQGRLGTGHLLVLDEGGVLLSAQDFVKGVSTPLSGTRIIPAVQEDEAQEHCGTHGHHWRVQKVGDYSYVCQHCFVPGKVM